jgi:hypothetical protein
VEVEGVVTCPIKIERHTDPPGTRALLVDLACLICLALDTQLHDMITTLRVRVPEG